ncbi:deoxyribonuclease V [Candidatus Parcubacteria bacterium]|nr:deoxyribonuclease V [Candidatus Parcubacteria bacterium]
MSKFHTWAVTPKNAIEIQQKLRAEVQIRPLGKNIKYIAGADISLNMFAKDIFAGIIVLKFPELEVIEHQVLQSITDFPYIPGLLSFREVPALLEVWKKVKIKPDILMVDGQGIAHPRRIGIASHIGVLLDVPTIGVAKSPLYGKFKDVGEKAGALSYIYDKYNKDEIIGVALRSKERSKPLIVSLGHKITLEEALAIVRNSLRGYRLPEPTRLAHELVNQFRKGEIIA